MRGDFRVTAFHNRINWAPDKQKREKCQKVEAENGDIAEEFAYYVAWRKP